MSGNVMLVCMPREWEQRRVKQKATRRRRRLINAWEYSKRIKRIKSERLNGNVWIAANYVPPHTKFLFSE